jgi:hypothetical protein
MLKKDTGGEVDKKFTKSTKKRVKKKKGKVNEDGIFSVGPENLKILIRNREDQAMIANRLSRNQHKFVLKNPYDLMPPWVRLSDDSERYSFETGFC